MDVKYSFFSSVGLQHNASAASRTRKELDRDGERPPDRTVYEHPAREAASQLDSRRWPLPAEGEGRGSDVVAAAPRPRNPKNSRRSAFTDLTTSSSYSSWAPGSDAVLSHTLTFLLLSREGSPIGSTVLWWWS